MITRTSIITTALALTGVGLWSYCGSELADSGKFDVQPNPLGLKMSPYGQVIAMAFQAPIDEDWHGGIEIHDHSAHATHDGGCDHTGCTSCSDHEEVAAHDGHEGHDHHGHDHDEHGNCLHGDHAAPEIAEHSPAGGCTEPDCGSCADHSADDSGSLIETLSAAVKKRNNPNPPTPQHQFYLRREIEKKLRFAYELDPSHYANYNTYHMFLMEPMLGTSKLPDDVARTNATALAEGTIRYCVREQVDPRPSITAAAAAYNIFEIMLMDDDAPASGLRKQIAVFDFCMGRHMEITQKSIESGTWNLISAARQAEIVERQRFNLKLREAAEKTILRIEHGAEPTASNDSTRS